MEMILWPKIRMGLLKEGSIGLNAKLCDQSTPQISTYQSKARTICTPSMNAPKYGATKQLTTPLDTSPPIQESCELFLLHHNLGASVYGVHIGRSLGWYVEICGVLWSNSLAFIPALPSCSNTILNLGHSIIFHPSPQIFDELA